MTELTFQAVGEFYNRDAYTYPGDDERYDLFDMGPPRATIERALEDASYAAAFLQAYPPLKGNLGQDLGILNSVRIEIRGMCTSHLEKVA
ncbi:MAG: hypothetical protein JWL88_23 [Parcubacteria group bacterium]|nr:hypothetical protein [Parcubacteria group bacterium]